MANTVYEYDWQPGTTWRTCREGGSLVRANARVTYQPIDPWNLAKRLDKPYHVFINGTAQLSYATLEAAQAHLIGRGFNPLSDPLLLYPNDTDVSVTVF
jgi:hypothetical protein